MKKKIIIASYIFPPLNSPGSDRVYSFAKYLSEFGHDVIVVTSRQYGDLKYNFKGFQVLEVGGKNVDNMLSSAKQKPSILLNILRKMAISEVIRLLPFGKILRSECRWVESAFVTISELINNSGCDILITSHPPSETIKLGSKVKVNFPKIKWVADYRDLFAKNHMTDYYLFVRFFLGMYEKYLIKNADVFIFASKGLLDDQSFLLPKTITKRVVYNGFWKILETPNLNIKSNKIVFVYTGSLYNGSRDIDSLIKLIGSSDRYILNIAVFNQLEKNLIIDLMVKYEVSKRRVNIYVNIFRDESIKLQSNADFLVLLLRKDGKDKAYPTAKLFEYLSLKKPIIGFGSDESEASYILKKLEAGVFIEGKDKKNEFFKEWLSKSKMPSNENVHYFSRRNQALELERFILHD